ncbi:MAG TPA: hypothetical protein VHO70_23880 [Chitinispirillaceae bacterium]|nr:hypothetical protein [Chitinispirillaceae bacterium]
MNRSLTAALLSLTILLPAALQAEISLTAYSREEALHEQNISKPRIVIKNTGTRPVHGFSFRYYIHAENGSTPVVDNYYTPGAQISMEYYGRGCYAVLYEVPGVTLYPGESYPDESGCVVGIHYPAWEPLFKNNDQSCNFSSVLVYNQEIDVQANDCHSIGGKEYRVMSSREEIPEHNEPVLQRSVSIDISLEYPVRKHGKVHSRFQ